MWSLISCGCLTAGKWSSVIITACLLKEWARLAPSLSLPLTCHHILQHWWWRYFILLAENGLLAEHTMQTNLHALKKILAFWTASQRCVPQLRSFDALVQFLQSVWLFYTPLGHTRSFVIHSLAGLLLWLPHLSWKLLLPLVTVEGNSLHLVLSVLFCEGLDTLRHGELGCCILLLPLISASSSSKHEPV